MLEFILHLILMLALGTMFFLIARALPRVPEGEELRSRSGRLGVLERWVTSDMPERVDLFLSSFLAKWLRKTRIFVLKLDNILGNHLKKVSHKNGNGESLTNGFKDIIEGE